MTGKRKTILITPLSTVLAHAARCLMIAGELHRRGHDVVLAGEPKYLSDSNLTGRSGYRYLRLSDWDLSQGLKLFREILAVPSSKLLNDHLEEELRLLDEIRPDIVIDDFRLTMFISARVRQIPIVSVIESRWLHDYCLRPWGAFRTFEAYFRMRWLLGENLTERLFPSLQRTAMRLKILPFRKLYKRYGLAPPRDLWNLYEGDFNLLLDIESWNPTKPLPQTFKQVGPIYWTPELPLPDWTERLDRDRPIIYLTLGSTGHPELFYRLFELFGGTDYQVIVTTGGQIEVEKNNLPANLFVERYLNGERITELADLVIHHGGTGTAYQAIRSLTPAIVIATHAEQQFLGESTQETGMGVWMTMIEALREPSIVLKAAERILGQLPQRREKIRRLKDEVDHCYPVKDAADWIERWLGVR